MQFHVLCVQVLCNIKLKMPFLFAISWFLYLLTFCCLISKNCDLTFQITKTFKRLVEGQSANFGAILQIFVFAVSNEKKGNV
jgi:hypothetical protein